MKIFALIPKHNGCLPDDEAVISLPDSTIVKSGNPVFVPDFDKAFTIRPFLAIKISRLGKSIASRFAHRYFDEVAPAFCINAKHKLLSLQSAGMPWTEAFAFDKSLPLGEFIPYTDLTGKDLVLEINGEIAGKLPTPPTDAILAAISRLSGNNTLKMGDLILIPFPGDDADVLIPDTNIRVLLEDKPLIGIPVR